MSSRSGMTLTNECMDAFNQLKMGRSGVKFVTYKIAGEKEIVLDEISKDPDYETFYKKLTESTQPYYAVYDFEYELEGGEGKRSKIVLIQWVPDGSTVRQRMTYSSSFTAIKSSLTGYSKAIEMTDADELSWKAMLDKVSGKA